MDGTGDMKGIPQPIVIRTINTESLSQRDPVQEPVSTLTGHLPGQNHLKMHYLASAVKYLKERPPSSL